MAHVDALSRNPVGVVMLVAQKDLVESMQQEDDSIRATINQLNDEISKGNLKGLANDYVVESGLLFRKVNGENKVVVPRQCRWSLVQSFHDNNGHVNYIIRRTTV
ncbi:hypothetical protein JYU34_006447 [Plutella xylostella]|uniref:Uncharacterized protein n=1 Tax=Plutella xylostella TaxID=51655 RepID=A0ABQ7QS44_PLUXY|nr:hypothetical protein JYU34_006447 [Plutella xylostella]